MSFLPMYLWYILGAKRAQHDLFLKPKVLVALKHVGCIRSFETSFMHPIGTLSFRFSVSQWVA